ncbi:alkaline-phosphatase-like protein [Pelagophyceae sp. CCMP2097]|nr:alkaline-phosphatase-like protein [Pelagophyceae sp. CCMP2097]
MLLRFALVASACASLLRAPDSPSAADALLGCGAEIYAAFEGSPRATVRGPCCRACVETAWCSAYNQYDDGFCDLFAGAARRTFHPNCSAGTTREGAPAGGNASAARGDVPTSAEAARPNVVFIVVESTDGRTWSSGYSGGAIPLPNLRGLQAGGVEFRRHYSNAPVCCPSRATFWSGRHAHNVGHDHLGLRVNGVWNNYEGLPQDYAFRLDQVVAQHGYQTKVSGKTDWTVGGHSESVFLAAWTMYAPFPYDVNATGGWATESMCGDAARVAPGGGLNGSGTLYEKDWATVRASADWVRAVPGPWFLYQGFEIVHPPYETNAFWWEKIDPSKIDVPRWRPLKDIHPCDFQTSNLKGCAPADAEAGGFYDVERRRNVRRAYFAQIAEFDDMVGETLRAIEAAGATHNTVVIVTSDHGDMQMEKQQFYKMSPYDASASVPMVIFDGRHPRPLPHVYKLPTQLIDIYPTVLDLAGITIDAPWLDGVSLAGIIGLAQAQPGRPDFVVTQFHGDNLASSWFAVISVVKGAAYKLVVWGNGATHAPLLFALDADPNEDFDLAGGAHAALAAQLDLRLRSVVDYAAVALDVATYNHGMFLQWANRTADWRRELASPSLRWAKAFNADADASLAAVDAWMAAPPEVEKCRAGLRWPPR